MSDPVMRSSNNMDWETPDDFFNSMDSVFHFDKDIAADTFNHKCSSYYTSDDNALTRSWSGICWLNPPYGRDQMRWIKKAKEELSSCNLKQLAFLVPARVDTRMWQKEIFNIYSAILFVSGRLEFKLNGSSVGKAAFPSALVIIGDDITDEQYEEMCRWGYVIRR